VSAPTGLVRPTPRTPCNLCSLLVTRCGAFEEASPSPVYGARLLSGLRLIPLAGSNPAASATQRRPCHGIVVRRVCRFLQLLAMQVSDPRVTCCGVPTSTTMVWGDQGPPKGGFEDEQLAQGRSGGRDGGAQHRCREHLRTSARRHHVGLQDVLAGREVGGPRRAVTQQAGRRVGRPSRAPVRLSPARARRPRPGPWCSRAGTSSRRRTRPSGPRRSPRRCGH
jgi:hypothetical protein